MEHNRFVSAAHDQGSADNEVSGLEMDAILALEDMDSYTWTQVKQKLREMQMRFKELQDAQRDAKVAALTSDGTGISASTASTAAARVSASGGAVANPMLMLAQARRSGRNFAPTRTGGAASPSTTARSGRRLLSKSSAVSDGAVTSP
jgi:hypothetical protein